MANFTRTLTFLGAFLALAGASILIRSSNPNDLFQEDINSCQGRCNRSGTIPNGCQCNTFCMQFGDCCPDYYTLCLGGEEPALSCQGKCGNSYNPADPCHCNSACQNHNNCCPDYSQHCEETSGPITNAELEALGEELFALEGPNNAASLMSWDLQGETTQGSTTDRAPLPLMNVSAAAYQKETVALLVALHDNYFADVSRPEEITIGEGIEENAFIDTVMATPIMVKLQEFMATKGITFGREKFREMWLGLYSRSGSVLGSSGLEHVFLAELKNGVSGFHNWAFFAKEEEAGRVNYRGWMEYVDLGSKGGIIQHNFQWQGQNKPISSMFLGTSPEFELAVYSACWLARPDSNSCPMSFGGQKVKVTTWTIVDKKFVASAYAM